MSGAAFSPRLDILTPPQRRLWDDLGDVPETFTLYRGTGLALHLGHRQSADFDFFGTERFDPDELLDRVPALAGGRVVQRKANTLSVRVDRGGPAEVSLFGVPEIGRVRPPTVAAGTGVRVASLLDIAGMKASVVQIRPEAKDYRDVAALLEAGVSLPDALAAGRAIYGGRFVPQITLMALSHYGDGDLPDLPEDVRRILSDAVASTDPLDLPDLSPVAPRSAGER